jgi:hypothetical protein
MQVHVDERNMRGAPKLKMCDKNIQTETKLGRYTVSFLLLLHICEEKDENEEFKPRHRKISKGNSKSKTHL